MAKDLRVLLVEDDPFARDLMSMLLARDWRTRVVAEAGSEGDLHRIFQNDFHNIDVIVLDTEAPDDSEWPFRLANMARLEDPNLTVVCTATRCHADRLRRIIEMGLNGYLVKPEIGYSLAAAVALAVRNDAFILTPASYAIALQERIPLPAGSRILDGRTSTLPLTPREAEIARLAILFNHPHRELSDELLIRADQVAKHVSSVYTKLGLVELLAGELDPEALFEDPLVLAHFRRILERVAARPARRKTADMATLAFHLLTVPVVRKVD